MAVLLPKTIRQWFTPEQACKYLSQAFECEIEQSDLDYFHFVGELNFQIKVNREVILSYQHENRNLFECSDIVPTLDMEVLGIEPQEDDRLEVFFKISPQIYNGVYVEKITNESETFIICLKELLGLWRLVKPENVFKGAKNAKPITLKTIRKIENSLTSHCLVEVQKYINDDCICEIGYTRTELNHFIDSKTEPTPEPQKIKDLNPTEREALHNIIKALANMVIDPTAPKEKEKSDEQRGKPPFKNQTQLIEFLSDKESGLGEWRGLSRPNLEKVFAKANKTN